MENGNWNKEPIDDELVSAVSGGVDDSDTVNCDALPPVSQATDRIPILI